MTHLSFLLFPLILLSLHRAAAAASSPSSSSSAANTDSQQLIDFKNTLRDPKLLPDWLPNQNPCDFTGVSCKSSRVASIELASFGLSTDFRSVSSHLLTLGFLESLSLTAANIGGALAFPSGSKCSAVLSSLDLSGNALSGPVSDIASLGTCQNLKVLNFSGNRLDNTGQESAAAGLRGLENLQVLDLSFNQISGSNVNVSWVLSGGCDAMTHLSLRGNKLTGDVDVSSCKKLQYLDVSQNNISVSVPALGDCSALEHLDVSSNGFYGDIGRAVSACSQLSFLNLSNNHFSGPIPSLPTKNLQYLYLSRSGFQGEIPPSLAELCPGLVELDLSHNNLSGVIPAILGSCYALQSIDLSNNNFSAELPMDLFMQMSKVRKLALSFNYFTGSLPDSLSNLTSLETLDLSSNDLSGMIPSGLCQDPRNSLKELYLQNNGFTGSIPPALSNCSQLVSLDLSFNYLKGRIPSSLGSLSKLQDLIILLNELNGEIPQELMYVQTLENLLLDFNELTGAIPSGLRNCTNLNWISLSNNYLSGEIPGWIGQLSNLAILKLSNNSFHGSIPPELGDSRSLIWLDLNSNQLNGSIPHELFKESGNIEAKLNNDKRYAYIKNDGSIKACHGAGNLLEYAGIRQMTRLSTRNPCNFTRVYQGVVQPTFKNNGSMIFLDISYNMLSGSIPTEIGSMFYLFVLNLGHNRISGPIPPEIGDLHTLNILDLSNNELEGGIPETWSKLTALTEINLSNNRLTGLIPANGQLGTLEASGFMNNTGLCGLPLPPCGSGPPSSAHSEHQKSHRQASLAGSVAMGLLFSLFCILGLMFVAMESRKRRKKKKDAELDVYIDSRSQSGPANASWKLTSVQEALSINCATFEKPLRKLTFADLLEATNGFHNDSLIGSGGFGDVYKAQLKDGNVVAIKKLIHVSGQGDREFTAEMETIGKIKHRNLVSLLGYCKVKEERLLVYEYMKYGSLEDVLHNQKKTGIKLNWAVRRKIAVGAARGLAFLHHNCIPHIIHRDMKSSNVLLDENLEARVSDFGMARLMSAMDTHLSVSTLAGTPGYVPPEYYQSFRCSTKGDVYSYGVVLLELLTGKRPTDSADFGDNNLVGWVKQHAKLKISDVFDQALIKEDPNLEIELLQHLKVACACLEDRPWRRPTMIQVLALFKEIQAGSGLDSMSTIATDNGGFDGSFGSVEMSDLSLKEGPEYGNP
ncbi:hypothetical protein BT93_I0321 [Corymbia citriodora subsp. variegata]|nr:hypothetical protein BT93_I0321 [Corymbia citriodora subsp. variegata]